MLELVSAFLKRKGKELTKADSGKFELSEEQSNEIKASFGERFLEKFNAHLNDEEDDDSKNSEFIAEMVTAMTEHAQALQLNHGKELKAEKEARIELEKNLKTLQATVATLSESSEEEPEPEVDASLPRAEGIKPVLQLSQMKLQIYANINHFIKTGVMQQVEASTIDVADLATEFGTYLSQNRNNLEIVTTLFQGFSSASMFTSAMATTEWRAMQALISSVSQQFTNKWTPSGSMKARPLAIRNRRHKINYPIIPSEVLESYAMYMYDESLAIDQMPITKFIWNNLIYPQLMQDIETRMIFKGKFLDVGVVAEGDAGAAPEDSMDGMETIIVDGKDGSKNINYFPDGNAFNFLTATDDQILAHVADFVAWIAPLFRSQAMEISCSPEFWRRYRVAYKNKWGAGSSKSDETNFGNNVIDFSMQTLVPRAGMYNSPILFAAPKANTIKLRHKNEVPRVINDVQKRDYEVRLFGEYWLGAGFAFGEGVFTSCPDGYDPKAQILLAFGAHTNNQQLQVIGSGGGGI